MYFIVVDGFVTKNFNMVVVALTNGECNNVQQESKTEATMNRGFKWLVFSFGMFFQLNKNDEVKQRLRNLIKMTKKNFEKLQEIIYI